MQPIESKTAPGHAEKLAYSGKELQRILDVSSVTIWRLEKKNLLKPVPGIKNKLYSRKTVEAFLEGKGAQ